MGIRGLLFAVWMTVGVLTPQAGKAAEIALARDGRALATIVVADKPDLTPAVRHERGEEARRVELTVADWAEGLAGWLERATGAAFPVVKASQAPGEGTLVLVGTSALSRRHGLDGSKGMKPEEARVVAFERGVALIGERLPSNEYGAMARAIRDLFTVKTAYPPDAMTDRGVGHAVAIFLENCAGCRFYYPTQDGLWVDVPQRADLTVAGGLDLREAPAYLYRFGMARGEAVGIPLEYLALRLGASVELSCNHVYNINEEEHSDRPELFARNERGEPMFGRRAGVPRCYTEPAVLDLWLEQVRVIDRTGKTPYRPKKGNRALATPTRVLIGPADARWVDHDPRSREWYRADREPTGAQSDLLCQFAARLAERVAEEWPGRRVTLMGQNNYAAAPSDRVTLPGNVDVLAAISVRPTPMNVQPVYEAYQREFLREWSEKLGGDRRRLALWDYCGRPEKWTKIPCFIPHVLQRAYRENRDVIAGAFVNPASDDESALPYRALWMRLMWNPDIDVDAWMDEFCVRMFGPAADPMRRLIALCAERYESTVWAEEPGLAVVPDEVAFQRIFPLDVVEQLAALMDAARAAAPADPEDPVRRRVEFLYNEGGAHGFHPFFVAARNYHSPHKPRPVVAPLRKEGDIVVDATMDATEWKGARGGELLQGDDPRALFPTEKWWKGAFRFVYTDKALYLGMEMEQEDEGRARAKTADELIRDDHVSLFIYRRKGIDPGAAQEADMDLTPEQVELALAKEQGDTVILVNPAGMTNLEGVTVASVQERGAWRLEARIPWSSLTLRGPAPPKRLMVDVRRTATQRERVARHPKRFAYATTAERSALLLLKRPD